MTKRKITIVICIFVLAIIGMLIVKIMPKYKLIEGTSFKLTEIKVDNGTVNISTQASFKLVSDETIHSINVLINNINADNRYKTLNEINMLYSKEPGGLRFSVLLCRIDGVSYIETISCGYNDCMFQLDSLESLDLSHLKALVYSGIPADKDSIAKLSEIAPNLIDLTLDIRVSFLEFDSASLIPKFKNLERFEFRENTGYKSLEGREEPYVEKLEELKKQFPEHTIELTPY